MTTNAQRAQVRSNARNASARIALTAVVCAASFFVSFRHIVEVARDAGNDAVTAGMYPVCIDAVILVSALYLVASTGVNKMAKLWATIGRYFGFSATVFANMAHSGWANPTAVIINLIPAVALIITMELVVYGFKATPAARASQATARKAAPRKAATAKAAPATPAKARKLQAV